MTTTSTLEHLHPSDPAYWKALRRCADPEPEATDYPAPIHTSRDPWPTGVTEPRPVTLLARLGQDHGWATKVTYSRGCPPHATTGRPGPVADWFAVRMFHPDSRARFVAIYSVRGSVKAWDGTLLTTPKIPPYLGCNITEGKAFVMAGGLVLPSFVDEVRQRISGAIAKAKAAPKKATGKRREVAG